MNPVKVYIASTAAPVAIQRIAREQGIDPGVYINRGTKPSCISDDYYYFVNKGSGVIERRVGFTDFRADLESEISGMSWQLSMALAHCLEQQNQLHNAFDKDATGSSVSTVIWATGTVNSDEEICEIKELLKKLQVSTKLFTQCQLKGIVVYIFFPASQKNEIPESWLLSNGLLENLIKLTPVSTLQDAINELPIEKDVSNEVHITADFAKKVEVEKLIHLRKWLAWKNYLVFPALLFLIEVGFEIWAYNNPPPSGNYIAAGVGAISINENANTHKQDINLQPLLHPDRVTLSASYANRGDRCRKNARSEPTNPISKKDLNNFVPSQVEGLCSLTYRLNLKNTKVNTENIIALAIDPVEKIVIPLARNESDSQISWELLAPVHQSRDRQYQIFFVANPATRSLLNTVRSMLLGSAVEKVVEEEFARQGGRFNPLALEQVFRDRDWLVISFYHTLQADW